MSFPQRGGQLTLDYHLYYTGKQWNVYTSGSSSQYWALRAPDSLDPIFLASQQYNPGTVGVNVIDPQYAAVAIESWQVPNYGTSTPTYIFSEAYVVDGRGSTHPLALDASGGFRTIDGSGYFVPGSVSPNTGVVDRMNFTIGAIYDHEGVVEGISRRDSNGNTINYLQGNTISDSIGRQIPAPAFFQDISSFQSIATTTNSTGCSGPLAITAAYNWAIPSIGGSVQNYKFCYATLNLATNFRPTIGPGVIEGTQTSVVLQSIVMPDLTTWTFQYSDRDPGDSPSINYGTLTQITTPAGATISYVYGMLKGCPLYSRGVISRTVNTNDVGPPQVWKYNIVTGGTTTVTDPMLNDTVHTFGGTCGSQPETKTQYYQGSSQSGSAPLKTVTTTYTSSPNVANALPGAAAQVNILPQTVTTRLDDGTTSSVQYFYDQSFVATDPNDAIISGSGSTTSGSQTYSLGDRVSEQYFDYGAQGSGAAGKALRSTQTTYQWQQAYGGNGYLANNLVTLPSSVVVEDGNFNRVAETDYNYDENNGSPQGAYGNLTSVSRWLNAPAPGSVTTSTVYTAQGVPSEWKDANGNLTSVSSWQCSNLFPQQVILAYQSQPPVSETISSIYDCNSSKLLSTQDPNGVMTQYSYNDPLNRVTLAERATTTSAATQTRVSYPTLKQVNVFQDKVTKGDGILQTSFVFDGLGRQIHRTTPDGATVDTLYDALGRVYSQSNPYFSGTSPGLNSTLYDALGRPLFQYHPDNTSLQWLYSGAITDSFDEIGRHWRRTADALGRLTQVLEPNGSTNMTVSPTLETDYIYDALDNLNTVTQHGASTDTPRVRSFTYDSLSRLLTSTNPETGTICYGTWSGNSCILGYDPNGNLLAKTDARLVTIRYTYDALNRLSSKSSSGGTGVASFTYNYTYDQAIQGGFKSAYPIGRLVLATSDVYSNVHYSYDPLGRVVNQEGASPTHGSYNANPISAMYDLAGDMTSLTYPDGRTVSRGFDSAGRLSSVNYASWGATAVNVPYLNVGTFSPTGQVLTATMGNGVGFTSSLDSRLRVANSAYTLGSTTLWSKGYTWGADNNLQVAANPTAGVSRQYNYDNLNRLVSAQDIAGSIASAGQTSDASEASAQENALISTQYLGGAYWGVAGASIVPNSAAAPDGSMTAITMTGSSGSTNSTIAAYSPTPTLFDNDTITASVWLRVPSGTLTTQIWVVDVGNNWAATKQSVALSTTWQQFTLSNISIQNGLITLGLQVGGTNTIAAGQVVDVWGAELEVASAPDTNILPSSQQIGAAGWQIAGASVTATNITAPDGSKTASTVTSSSASAVISDTVANPSQYNGQTVTGSIYLCLPSGSSSQSLNLYLLDTSSGASTYLGTKPITLTTTWQRFWVTGTAQSSLTQLSLQVGGGTPAFASGQAINMWGAQMVLGSAEGTYVATADTTKNPLTGATEYLAANGMNESYAYDAFGNLQQTGNFTFSQAYTAANQLSGWSYDAAGNLLSNQINNSFTYDANGMVNTAGGFTYFYDPLGNRVGKSGTTATDTIYFGGRPIARLTGTAWTDLIYGPSGLLAEVPGSQTGAPVYRMLDHLGSEVGTLSSTGSVLSIQDYAPFGQVFSGNPQDPYQFTGKERDQESGLDYFGARYYPSNMGRWMSPDPSGIGYADAENPQSLNLYNYVNSNPMSFVDPNGMLTCGSAGGATAENKVGAAIIGFFNKIGCAIADAASAVGNALSSPVQAASPAPPGSATAAPSPFQRLWANYPSHQTYPTEVGPNSFWQHAGGGVQRNGSSYTNSCAARMCYALNRSGFPIPHDGDHLTVTDSDRHWSYLRLTDLQPFLIKNFGQPRRYNANNWRGQLSGQTGIMMFDYHGPGWTGHAALWNGSRFASGDEWDDYSAKSTGVLFWPIP